MPKRKIVLRGFAIGALVPVFWGIAGMIGFGAPEGRFSELFWKAVYLTCPPWRLQLPTLAVPVLNGVLYAVLAVPVGLWVGRRRVRTADRM